MYAGICLAMGAIVATMLAALAAGRFRRRGIHLMLCFALARLPRHCSAYQTNTYFGPFFYFADFLAGG